MCYFVFHYFPHIGRKVFFSFKEHDEVEVKRNDKILLFLIKLKFFLFSCSDISKQRNGVSSINIKIFWRGNSNGKLKNSTLLESWMCDKKEMKDEFNFTSRRSLMLIKTYCLELQLLFTLLPTLSWLKMHHNLATASKEIARKLLKAF